MRKTTALLMAVSAALILGLLAGGAAGSGRMATGYTFRPIASGLADPTCVTSAPGDARTLYVVELQGRIRTVQNGRVTGTFLDISDRVSSGGERGLLSLAFHPRYAENHLFYVDYTDLAGDT